MAIPAGVEEPESTTVSSGYTKVKFFIYRCCVTKLLITDEKDNR
jgi:hypothetical protein